MAGAIVIFKIGSDFEPRRSVAARPSRRLITVGLLILGALRDIEQVGARHRRVNLIATIVSPISYILDRRVCLCRGELTAYERPCRQTTSLALLASLWPQLTFRAARI